MIANASPHLLAAALRRPRKPPVAKTAAEMGLQGPAVQWDARDPYKPKGNVRVVYDGGARANAEMTPQGPVIHMQKNQDPGQYYHELGHAYDYTTLDDAARRHFMAIMHYQDPRGWGQQGAAQSGYPNPPREQFGEAYRILVQHPEVLTRPGFQKWSGYGSRGYDFNPTMFQLRKIANMLKQYSGS